MFTNAAIIWFGGVLVGLIAMALWAIHRAPMIDEAACPYGVSDCGGPCEERPPCADG